MREVQLESAGPSETQHWGRRLGQVVQPGLVVGLIGPLGAGKTTFVRGVAEGAGVEPRSVTSPTFILIQEYDGRLPVYHFDTYRLEDPESFVDLGVDEYFFGDGVCLVEWADRFPECLPSDRLEIRFTTTGEDARRLDCLAIGEQSQRALNEAWGRTAE